MKARKKGGVKAGKASKKAEGKAIKTKQDDVYFVKMGTSWELMTLNELKAKVMDYEVDEGTDIVVADKWHKAEVGIDREFTIKKLNN